MKKLFTLTFFAILFGCSKKSSMILSSTAIENLISKNEIFTENDTTLPMNKYQEKLLDIVEKSFNNSDILNQLNQMVELKPEKILKNNHYDPSKDVILIMDIGMKTPALTVGSKRVLGIYNFIENDATFVEDKESISVPRWFEMMMTDRYYEKGYLHTDAIFQMKNLIFKNFEKFQIVPPEGHGNPIFSLLLESTQNTQFVLARFARDSQDFGPIFSCKNGNESAKEGIRNYFDKFSKSIVQLVQKHHIRYVNASWGVDAYEAFEKFSADCQSNEDIKDLILYYLSQYNKIFKTFSDLGVVVAQAAVTPNNKEGTNPVVDQMKIEERYLSDCEKINSRTRVGNIQLKDENIMSPNFFDSPQILDNIDWRSPNKVQKNLIIKCGDTNILRLNQDVNDYKNGLMVLVSGNFYDLVRYTTNSYFTPFYLSWLINLKQENKNNELYTKQGGVFPFQFMKKTLDDLWPYQLGHQASEVLINIEKTFPMIL